MKALFGYQIGEILQEGLNTVICRGIKKSDGSPVIIKRLKQDYPTLEQIAALRYEYEISHSLELPGVVNPLEFICDREIQAIVLEDFGGESLKDFLSQKTLSLQECLHLGMMLVEIIGQLHERQIIHKDIKPSNIIINPATCQVKIADFSIASRLWKENPTPMDPNLLEGTLAYMSPEQTGRMNRCIDYRTDYYSLGVSFYEMLTGQLPFTTADPMELIHAHMAKTPIPPHHLNREIPPVVSDIVMKLMAKTAEERYQSAAGIQYDLQCSLDRLQSQGAIAPFQVGARDKSAQLLIPQKLYGREREVATLMQAFQRVSFGAAEMMAIAGYSGIGKSFLVQEIHKPLVKKRGYFIKGKFDQFKRNIPYDALIQAFAELIRQLLTENRSKIAYWKQQILAAVGDNGQLIIDVIPTVERIIGKQPPVAQLGPTESQNRFHRVFQQFIRVFTQKQHPLVLFLDDLQWADSASLQFLDSLMSTPDTQYLLWIGAYRDNEVSAVHPLMQCIENMENAGAVVNSIQLTPLSLSDVKALVADTLESDRDLSDRNAASLPSAELAQLLFHKTGGNPFFLTQMLQSLATEKLLQFDFISGNWQWNIAQIQAIGITDKSVIELVARNIEKLPESTQELVKLAACIGNQFTLEVLAIARHQSQSETATELWAALQAGLILPASNAYKIPMLGEIAPETLRETPDRETFALKVPALQGSISYKFLHDRVQQAAYSLIPETQKKATHLNIGQLLLQSIPPEDREANIFTLVNQLNVGADTLELQTEKEELAQLNLIAGQKAKAATAYEAAVRYLNEGLNLLSPQSWTAQYQLTLHLHVEAVEAEYLNRNFQGANQLADIVLQRAQTLLDRASVYEKKLQFYIAQNQMAAAVDIALEVLEMLGISLPKNAGDMRAIAGLLSTKVAMAGKRIEDLAQLPEMTQPDKIAAMRILMNSVPPVFIAKPELFPLIVFTMIKLSLKYGNAPISAYAYAAYGMILCGIVGDIKQGSRFGELGLQLLGKLNAKPIAAKVYLTREFFIRHWQEHVRYTLDPLQKGIYSGLETGDQEFACHCAAFYCNYLFLSGEALPDVQLKQSNYLELMGEYKQAFQLYYGKIWHQVVLNLQGQFATAKTLAGPSFDEGQMLPQLIESGNRMVLFPVYLAKLFLHYCFGDYSAAVENACCALHYEEGALGTMNIPLHNFYYSLALLGDYPQVDAKTQKKYLKQVKRNQKKLKKWAVSGGANYQHKYELVAAELWRIQGKYAEAAEEYDRAIAGAQQSGYLPEAALAHELAGTFYLQRGKEKIARVYLTDAYYAYMTWGAGAKVSQLEQRYPQFLSRVPATAPLDITVTRTTKSSSTESTSAALDLSSLLKAYRAISGEILLDRLLDKLMQVLMENAGAQKGLLLLRHRDVSASDDNPLVLAAECSVEPENVIVMPFVPLEERPDLPISVINYVARTEETVVLNDAVNEELFAEDSYITTHQPKSIVGVPVRDRGTLTGVLYLENRLTVGAFTRDRLEILSLLAAQAAISLDNANLYQDLQRSAQREREKATELQRTLEKLQTTQVQLIQTEKMSSLGQLVAGVAHEINNPVGCIYSNLPHAEDYMEDLLELIALYQQHYPHPAPQIRDRLEEIELEFLVEDLPQVLRAMKIGADRIREIVQSLRTFSRVDEAEVKAVDLHAGIDSTLLILHNRLKPTADSSGINIIKEYGSLPPVECYPGQLNQVFMNIIANAIDALESNDQGQMTISIRTEVVGGDVVAIRISDNGPGIPESVRDRLFDPFFTTKPPGKGTGIGLSISYQIIADKHQGQIQCVSTPGKGTEFIIEIPLRQAHRKSA
ncbi:trifunctional serine/threonine-protein kinase/ATP-binding protein/sensor histidine kinase [Phormidium sp. CCY1219]|uniref:trifunctional serine/threonine-protein kinase/ATP-binding protein/sensor histidine kinase n=1 Tax=Phormidium sp. CCY1219 TaxID=2886104 RepID=UPI002D1EFA2B|nr:AAA family ATPase [Phormidium sp. CCY1219]MEB3829706.1 trifunctional serine/threonine-protein kinase/ATP-binding protein/sensor histidine kinase [Phormidium sp. CCY1219]